MRISGPGVEREVERRAAALRRERVARVRADLKFYRGLPARVNAAIASLGALEALAATADGRRGRRARRSA